MVRLRLERKPERRFLEQGFNPTMVRLRLTEQNRRDICAALFQSHYGAIATLAKASISGKDCGFNPTMVRLRPLCPFLANVGHHAFQSHYGAIATPAQSDIPVVVNSFNPTMVRLRL